MNIRKILNIPNELQLIQLNEDKKLIIERCNKIALTENREQQENKNFHDSNCPNCKNRNKESIVDKLIIQQSEGNIRGYFYFGFGIIVGDYTWNVFEINHCNKCGNEWIKYKIKTIDSTHILRIVFKYLAQILANPNEKKNEWKLEAIQVFDNCTAEAIHSLRKKQSKYLPKSINKQLSLKNLRRYYKSIYDSNKNKKILEKI